MSLGRYPAVTVARVGTLHGKIQERLDKGIDPASETIEKRQEERAAAKEKVFSTVYEAFAADHLARLRTGEKIKRKFEMDILPQWRRRRVDPCPPWIAPGGERMPVHSQAPEPQRTLRSANRG